MNESEAKLLEFTKRWQRDRLSREVAGDQDESDESDAPTPAPLSKAEVKNLLLRDRGTKEKS